MEITRENIGDLTATVKMVLTPADYTEQVNKVLKDFQRKANIPGFRPGHVPFGMVKKMYGSAVFADEVNKIISEKLHSYITDEKLEILGQPLPNTELTEQFDWQDGKNVEFYFDLGFAPKFDVELNDKIAVDYHLIKVDDSMLDKYEADMRQRFGTMSNPEIAGENDILLGEMVELSDEGVETENGIKHTSRIAINTIKDEAVRDKMIGAKKGDMLTFNPLTATGNATETAAMLDIEKGVAENLTSNFNFTVTEITSMVPAEMNDEFFEKVFPGAEVKTTEDFRQKVAEEAGKAFVADSDHLFSHHAQEKLMEVTPIALPDAFMKRWLVESNEGRITAEEVERDYDKYAQGMKWQLIENKLIREADIRVEDQEIKDTVKDYYLQGWRTMPLTDDLAARLDSIAESFMKDKPRELNNIVDSLYGQKVMAYVKSKVKLNEKTISYDDFIKLDAEKH